MKHGLGRERPAKARSVECCALSGSDAASRQRGDRNVTKTITFSTTGSYAILIAYGTLIFLGGLVPSTIVACQWLLPHTTPPSTALGSVIPGVGIMIWGLWFITKREYATVDADQGTITWARSLGWGTGGERPRRSPMR